MIFLNYVISPPPLYLPLIPNFNIYISAKGLAAGTGSSGTVIKFPQIGWGHVGSLKLSVVGCYPWESAIVQIMTPPPPPATSPFPSPVKLVSEHLPADDCFSDSFKELDNLTYQI